MCAAAQMTLAPLFVPPPPHSRDRRLDPAACNERFIMFFPRPGQRWQKGARAWQRAVRCGRRAPGVERRASGVGRPESSAGCSESSAQRRSPSVDRRSPTTQHRQQSAALSRNRRRRSVGVRRAGVPFSGRLESLELVGRCCLAARESSRIADRLSSAAGTRIAARGSPAAALARLLFPRGAPPPPPRREAGPARLRARAPARPARVPPGGARGRVSASRDRASASACARSDIAASGSRRAV